MCNNEKRIKSVLKTKIFMIVNDSPCSWWFEVQMVKLGQLWIKVQLLMSISKVGYTALQGFGGGMQVYTGLCRS